MSMEFNTPQDGHADAPPDIHPHSADGELSESFYTGPQETALTPTDASALTARPELPEISDVASEAQAPAAVYDVKTARVQFFISERNPEGRTIVRPGSSDVPLQRVNDWFVDGKQTMLDAYPPKTDGLDMDRAQAFMGKLGLRMTDLIIRDMSERAGIEPDLYRTLRDDFNDKTTFVRGLSYVGNTLGLGDWSYDAAAYRRWTNEQRI